MVPPPASWPRWAPPPTRPGTTPTLPCSTGLVRVTLRTNAAAGVTTLDVDLARRISSLAAHAGAIALPASGQAVEIAIDTMDADRIRPFWAAVLGYVETGRVTLVDPNHLGPPVWFQQMDAPRTERQRFHIDVTVPHDEAEARVAAALAAGGRLATDQYARSWWVLADAARCLLGSDPGAAPKADDWRRVLSVRR